VFRAVKPTFLAVRIRNAVSAREFAPAPTGADGGDASNRITPCWSPPTFYD